MDHSTYFITLIKPIAIIGRGKVIKGFFLFFGCPALMSSRGNWNDKKPTSIGAVATCIGQNLQIDIGNL